MIQAQTEVDEYALLEELRERGNKSFPITLHLFQSASPGSTLHYHWHREWQWMLMDKGSGVFVINGIRYHLSAGEAIFVNSGKLHSGFTENDAGCSHLDIIFHKEQIYGGLDIVNEYFENFRDNRYEPQLRYHSDIEGEREVVECLREILNAHQSKYEGHEIIIKAKLLEILAHIIHYNLLAQKSLVKKPRNNKKKQDYILTTIDYIHRNYTQKLFLEVVAAHVGVSVQALCRAFKEHLGTTVTDYVNAYRIYKSTVLLSETAISIQEIAKLCGFENTSYFIKVFKKYKGITPVNFTSARKLSS